jgi:glycosyltransferase involved in cell wall biosynthesis
LPDPLVSVVIPTYNRAALLVERCLPSVLQATQRLEVIVVGDGPQPEAKRAVAGLHDARVRFCELPERQTYPEDLAAAWCVLGLEARNLALDLAQGDYVAPLDDDDAWTPDHLDVLMACLNDTGADYAYGRSEAYWQDSRRSWYGQWPPMHFSHCVGSQVFRHDLGYRYDPACVERGLPEDGDMIDRMVAGGVRFAFVNHLVHLYWPNRQ